jgi:predicted alpha/beta superfamily hydrolase
MTKDEKRILHVYLPPGYHETDKRYPVLYMQDGQNLFSDHLSYTGVSWGVPEAFESDNGLPLHIVVGIEHPEDRLSEYSPFPAAPIVERRIGMNPAGKGDRYASFLVETVKPFIDKTYRTLPDDQSIAGSSMGAYIAAYACFKYPAVFQKVGIFSIASWYNEPAFLGFIENTHIPFETRIFISIGKNETSDENNPDFPKIYLEHSRRLFKTLEKKDIRNILYLENDGTHHERAWRALFPDFIRFISCQ